MINGIKSNLFFLLFLMMTFSCVKGKDIVINQSNSLNGIPLNEHAQFAVIDSKNEIPKVFIPYDEFSKMDVESKKAVWIKFSIKSTARDTVFIFCKNQIAKMELYSMENTKPIRIGSSGFAGRISENSIRKNYGAIAVAPFSEKTFLLKISSERYMLSVPTFYASYFLYNNPDSFSINSIILLTAGFEFCLFLIAVLFLLFNGREEFSHYVIPFLLINITDAVYFLSRSNFLIVEPSFVPFMTNSHFWNALGDVNMLLYYLFYRNFFDIPKKSLVHKVTTIGIIFWIVQILVELTDFTNHNLAFFASHYLGFASILDSLVLVTILIFVYGNRLNTAFYKLGAIGLTLITISSLEVLWNRIFDGKAGWVNLSLSSFKLLQFAILVNLMAFITTMIYNYTKSEKEKSEIKLQLLTHELERERDIQRERERISDDMHDDLGAGISAMKLQIEYIRNKVRDENVREDLDDLLNTSADMHLSMREMLWSLNSKNDNVQNFVFYVTNYAQNFFNKAITDVHFHLSNLSNAMISAETRRNLFLCLKEGMNNVYKHSSAKNVNFNFEQTDCQLIITLKDDGVGISPQKFMEGNGISSMKRRMALLAGDFHIIESEKGVHLCFILNL